jgi:hypothetical protein
LLSLAEVVDPVLLNFISNFHFYYLLFFQPSNDDSIFFDGNIDEEKEKILSSIVGLSRSDRLSFVADILTGNATSRQAAVAFSALLALEAERRVSSVQTAFWGPILFARI